MAEKSILWTTGVAGDGASQYTETELFDWLSRTFTSDPANEAVIVNYEDALEVTGTSSPLSIAKGAALVNGIPYENFDVEDLTVPTPSIGPTAHYVVLRADYTTNTVRIALLSSADGIGTPPALTQNASIWEVPLAVASITTGGVITVTDARNYLHYNTRIRANMFGDGVIPGSALAADSVDDTKAGNRVPQFYRRQGGDVTDWNDDGTTTYTPGPVRMQGGSVEVTIPIGQDAVEFTVTYPVAFSGSPLRFATISYTTIGSTQKWPTVSIFGIAPNTLTECELHVNRPEGQSTAAPLVTSVNWLAIGPE